MTSTQQAGRDLARTLRDLTGNMPPLPGIFPDYMAPIARNNQGTRELAMARWACQALYLHSRAETRMAAYQSPQCEIPALAALAGRGEPLGGALHKLLGK